MFTAYIDQNSYSVEFEKNSKHKGFFNGEEFEIDLQKLSSGSFHLLKNRESYNIEVVSLNKEEKTVVLKINGKIHNVTLKNETDELLKKMGLTSLQKKSATDVKAPMPGLVSKIFAKEGDTVKKNDVLLVLEAMKMENNIKSAIDGKIKKISAIPGKPVEKNEVLIVFE